MSADPFAIAALQGHDYSASPTAGNAGAPAHRAIARVQVRTPARHIPQRASCAPAVAASLNTAATSGPLRIMPARRPVAASRLLRARALRPANPLVPPPNGTDHDGRADRFARRSRAGPLPAPRAPPPAASAGRPFCRAQITARQRQIGIQVTPTSVRFETCPLQPVGRWRYRRPPLGEISRKSRPSARGALPVHIRAQRAPRDRLRAQRLLAQTAPPPDPHVQLSLDITRRQTSASPCSRPLCRQTFENRLLDMRAVECRRQCLVPQHASASRRIATQLINSHRRSPPPCARSTSAFRVADPASLASLRRACSIRGPSPPLRATRNAISVQVVVYLPRLRIGPTLKGACEPAPHAPAPKSTPAAPPYRVHDISTPSSCLLGRSCSSSTTIRPNCWNAGTAQTAPPITSCARVWPTMRQIRRRSCHVAPRFAHSAGFAAKPVPRPGSAVKLQFSATAPAPDALARRQGGRPLPDRLRVRGRSVHPRSKVVP